jgi:hypothetical protein
MRRFRVPPHPGIERPRRLILKLLLPGVNLVGMDLVALRKVRDRRLLPSASSAIFASSPASIPRLVFFVIVRSVYQTEPPFSNLTSGPKKRGPLHFAAMPNSVNMLFPFRAERRDGATFEMCAAGGGGGPGSGRKTGRDDEGAERPFSQGSNGST